MATTEELKQLSHGLRRSIIDMIHHAGSGHSGGSLSCAEIVTVLYENIMRVKPEQPDWPDRDRFILSKGHAAPALYATLARKGFFSVEELKTLRQLDSCLQGHPCMFKLPGIEMSTGSLGMGISVGVGMALSAKLLKKDYRIYVLCGDGEMQEGQNWEALMSLNKWGLDNITVIIDRNHVQLDGTESEIMPLGDMKTKLEAFGLNTVCCDGHDVDALIKAFENTAGSGGPAAIVAETVKGKGIAFMEGKNTWHGKVISDEDYELALQELNGGWKLNGGAE